MKKLLFLLSLIAVASSARADFTIALDAGQLAGMPVGGLLVIVAAGEDGSFSNSLNPGQYVSGNDILLSQVAFPNSSGAFNTSGGTQETINPIVINTSNFPTLATGDLLALRWFPQITQAQFLTGTTPSAGQTFGTYNPLAAGNPTNNPDGGSVWAVPSAGATINLDFFTANSDGGGTQPASAGFANFTVTAVPEPATVVSELFGGAILGASLLLRRFKR
jgi:hypothetical protein